MGSSPEVETGAGRVRGTVEQGGLRVFRGIPFARPPVGPRRFAPPEPPVAWTGVRAAEAFGPVSVQSPISLGFMGAGQQPQSEDCLYLNVWTPGLEGRRPVMVWIHGGAFVLGAGSEPLYDGRRLAARGDVVVVSLNYRLGALGYLTHPELRDHATGASGNWGLLDQIAALRWVRENAGSFGGDPSNVTVFGESAGAMSVTTLMATPAARGLFQRAIAQSGAPVTARYDEAAATAERVSALLDVPIARLREVPADQLVDAQQRMMFNRSPRQAIGISGDAMPFRPTVDGETLPRQPEEAVGDGHAADVALLIGTNRDEMKLFRAAAPATIPDERMLQRTFGAAADEAIATYTAARPGLPLSDVWTDVLTDQVFRIPAIRLAEKQAQQGAPVWMYRFDWTTPALGGLFGACHALEIPFVWDNLETAGLAMLIQDFAGRQQLANRMHFAWIAFARTGNPNTPELPNWPIYNTDHRATMLFDEECRVVDDPQSEERRLWKGLL